MKSAASIRSKSSKSDSIKFDTFVTVDTELPSPSSERGGVRVVLSPKRKNSSSSLQKKDSFSPKRKKSILGGDTREKENCLVYKRPQAPQRPMPHMPPKINLKRPDEEDSDEEEIEATFSISKSLREPLYLSSARILNTPENSSGESFDSHEDLKSPVKSEEDVKLRLSITRSTGGIGTSIPREFFDSVDSKDTNETDRRISTPPVQSDEKKDSATTVRTSSVIDALRIQTSDRGTSSCTVCGKSHNPRHSRVCIMCFRPMCKQCKKLNMVKLAKKSWVCNQCVACVKVEFPIQNDFCSVCTLPKCRRSRSCVLCKKHFCEVCKKEHMFKLGTAKWICHKHSMKEAFFDLKQNVSDD